MPVGSRNSTIGRLFIAALYEVRGLTEQADTARFLVFDAPSAFTWESVLLSGPLSRVPESELDEIEDLLAAVWRPSVFENAVPDSEVAIYRFRIETQDGFQQTGVPPGFDE